MVPSTTSSLMRAAAVRSVIRQNQRMGARSARQASHAAAAADHGDSQYPEEGFSGAFWRNTVLSVVLSVVAYRVSLQYTPAAKGPALDEAHDPHEQPAEAADKDMPYLTRYLAYHMPREGLWKERADKHLELTLQQAEDQLLLQDAQRPKMRRLRYPGSFEQASPHGIAPGSTVDMSDLKVKLNFNAPVGED